VYELDTDRFWFDDAASQNRPFSTDKPQVPMQLRMTEECIWAELGLEPDPRYEFDEAFRLDLNRRYNEKARAIVGRAQLSEEPRTSPELRLPPVRTVTELFGARVIWRDGIRWDIPTISSPEELERRLDEVEKIELDEFVFPPGWRDAYRRHLSALGWAPKLGGDVRGPVTAAMSVVGVENCILWLYDAPSLMERFRDLLAEKIVEIDRLLRQATGASMRGFGVRDDNCALLNPELYARFGLPMLQRIFAEFSPDPADRRYQHSDSEMSHLLPILAEAGLNGANFGPTVDPREIRRHLPRCVIYGQLPPFTFSRGTPEEIFAAVRRDIEWVGADGGLVLTTAGSVNAGSRLEGLRAVMAAIQKHGRYRPL